MDKNTKRLFKAAKRNLFEDVVKLIEEKGVSTTQTSRRGRTIGHIAVRNGNLDMLNYVVEKDPSILRIEDEMFYNIFHLAVKRGALDMVKYLVEKQNEDICQKFATKYEEVTALNRAVMFGHTNMVKYFIGERHVDANGCHKDPYWPPLFLAVQYNRTDIVSYLVDERNVNLTLLDYDGENILYPAVRKGDLNLIKHLLEDKKVQIDVNSKNHEGDCLISVILGGYFSNREDPKMKIFSYLVEKKNADVNILVPEYKYENSDETRPHTVRIPLVLTICSNEWLTEYLIEHGANASAVDERGKNLLHYPYRRSKDHVNFLIKQGVDVNQKDSAGMTPLHRAIEEDSYERCVCLIEGGADCKENLVRFAISRGRDKLIKYLLQEKRIDMNATDWEGKTLLHRTADSEYWPSPITCEQLACNVSDINRQDRYGNTALHYAAKKGRHLLCKCLVDCGASVRVQNNRRKVPSDMIPAGKWYKEVKNFLEECAASNRSRRNAVDYYAVAAIPRDRAFVSHENEYRKMIDGGSHVQGYHFRGGDTTISFSSVSAALQNLFFFTRLLFPKATNGVLSFEKEERSSVYLAPRASLMSRMDPIAEDAIYALPDIEEK